MSPVAIPEKTLEHWCSQYLTYRYRSKLGLWWPTRGEDVSIDRWFAGERGPGKAVQLEIKTCTPAGDDQVVKVDLKQLDAYLSLPHAQRPFYVFPRPDWRGDFAAWALRQSVDPSDAAFKRSGSWWFADWMGVLTAGNVARLVSAALKAHRATPGTRKPKHVALLTVKNSGTDATRREIWGERTGHRPAGLMLFRDFLSQVDMCGRQDWPQMVRVSSPGSGKRITHTRIRQLLESAANEPVPADGLETYLSDGEGGFYPDERDGATQVDGLSQSNRTVAFITAEGLAYSREHFGNA